VIQRSNLFGWKQDEADKRDTYLYSMLPKSFPRAPIAANNFDLLPERSYDQQDPNCVSQAVVLAIQMLTKRDGLKLTKRAVQYLHRFARAYAGQEQVNTGAYPRLALKAAQKLGIPGEAFWPESRKFYEQPDAKAMCDAYAFRTLHYSRLNTLDQVRTAIASRLPVIAGLQVGEAFLQDRTGTTPHGAPETQGDVIGRHMVTLTGYDAESFYLQNSWGDGWGNNGQGRITNLYLRQSLGGDVYALTL